MPEQVDVSFEIVQRERGSKRRPARLAGAKTELHARERIAEIKAEFDAGKLAPYWVGVELSIERVEVRRTSVEDSAVMLEPRGEDADENVTDATEEPAG